MVIADVWAAVGGVGSVLAASAAAAAVWFAKQTVDEARAGRREEQQAHEQVLASHRAQLDAITAAHRYEMAERAQALASERQLEVLRKLDRVAAVLLELADCAREEAIAPPARLSEVSPIPLTRIPGILAGLRAAVASLPALDGPVLSKVGRLADHGYHAGTPPMHFVGEAFDGLQELETAISTLRSPSKIAADPGE